MVLLRFLRHYPGAFADGAGAAGSSANGASGWRKPEIAVLRAGMMRPVRQDANTASFSFWPGGNDIGVLPKSIGKSPANPG